MAQTVLRTLIHKRGWTYRAFRCAYEQAAQEVAATTGDRSIATATIEEVTFRRWTAGRVKTLPNYPAPQILEHLFRCAASKLLQEASKEFARPSTHVPVLEESELEMTARDAAAHASDAASLSLPDMTLDQLADDIATLARSYNRTAPLEVFRRAKELLHLSQTMLDRTQVPRQRTLAYLAAGQSAALLSGVCFDLGSLPTAVQLSRTAALYGKTIEHDLLQAYAHGSLALLAFWGGRPSEAVRLIRTAQQFGGLGDTAVSRLSVIEARAHAHLGERREAEHAIRVATEQDTGVRDELHDDIGGEFGFPDDRVAMSNATTYLLLRDASGAEAAASHALALSNARATEQRSLRVPLLASVELARARLVHQQLDTATEALQPVFQMPSEWASAGLLERLAAARRELTRRAFRGAMEARTLGDRIEEFSSVTASRLLGGSQLAVEGPA